MGSMNEKEEICNHHFEIGRIATEATDGNIIYHQVGYAVCVKCGEIRKMDV